MKPLDLHYKTLYERTCEHNAELRSAAGKKCGWSFLTGLIVGGCLSTPVLFVACTYIYARRVEAFLAEQGICEYRLNPKTGETEFVTVPGPVTIDSPLQTLWDARDITRF